LPQAERAPDRRNESQHSVIVDIVAPAVPVIELLTGLAPCAVGVLVDQEFFEGLREIAIDSERLHLVGCDERTTPVKAVLPTMRAPTEVIAGQGFAVHHVLAARLCGFAPQIAFDREPGRATLVPGVAKVETWHTNPANLVGVKGPERPDHVVARQRVQKFVPLSIFCAQHTRLRKWRAKCRWARELLL